MVTPLRPLIPDVAFRAGWSSSAFLLYAGAYLIAASVISMVADLSDRRDIGELKLVAYSGLLVVLMVVVANALRRTGDRVPAGLFAVIGLILFGVWVGLTESWLGIWPDDTESFVPSDFELGIPLLAVFLVAAGLGAIQLFRVPLLVLPIAVAAWYVLVYVVLSAFPGSPGEDAQGLVALVVGLLTVATGVSLDRMDRRLYAFWLHVVGGAAVMGGLIPVLGDSSWGMALFALIAVAFVVAAEVFGRSSYTVLGAVGFIYAGTYFIDKWFSSPPEILFFPFTFFFFGFFEGGEDQWSGALASAFLGFIVFEAGFVLHRGWLRGRTAAP